MGLGLPDDRIRCGLLGFGRDATACPFEGREAASRDLSGSFITIPIIRTQTIFPLAFTFFLGYVFFQESFSE
jgi:hypothetical protein